MLSIGVSELHSLIHHRLRGIYMMRTNLKSFLALLFLLPMSLSVTVQAEREQQRIPHCGGKDISLPSAALG